MLHCLVENRMLEKDKEEVEMLKRAKEEEEEKAMYSVSSIFYHRLVRCIWYVLRQNFNLFMSKFMQFSFISACFEVLVCNFPCLSSFINKFQTF